MQDKIHKPRAHNRFLSLPVTGESKHGRPLRVCIVSPEFIGLYRNGGIGTAYTSLGETLAAAGHSVTFLFTQGRCCENRSIEFWQAHYKEKGISFVPLPDPPSLNIEGSWYAQTSYKVYQWLRQYDFDVVHFPEMNGLGYYAMLAKHQGLAFPDSLFCIGAHSPSLWIKEANSEYISHLFDLGLDFVERQSMVLADVVWSPSQYLLAWMQSQGWNLPPKCYVQPYILPRSARPAASGNDIAAARRNIREIVFFGRLEPRKGLAIFCEAINLLATREKPAMKITFLGREATIEGRKSKDYIHEKAKDWPFQWQVLSEMDQPEAIRFLKRRGRLAVIASPMDNSPNTVLECLGMSIPFIACQTGGIPELIAAEDIDSVSFQFQPEDLAQKICSVLRNGICPAKPAIDPQKNEKIWVRWHEELLNRSFEMNSSANHPTDDLPLVSVCLVHHNRPAFLRQALSSIQAQDYTKFEVVLVDDGSTDSEAMALLNELEPEFAAYGWQLIRQDNRYLGAARNSAVRHAHGEYVLIMDDDNFAKPHELSTFVRAAQKSGADILTSCMDFFSGQEPPGQKQGAVTRSIYIGGASAVGIFGNCFGDANSFIRRDLFSKIGGFSEAFGVTHEDWAFFAKALLAGYRLEVVPEALFWYRQNKESMIRTTDKYANHRQSLLPYMEAMPEQLQTVLPFLQGLVFRVNQMSDQLAKQQETIGYLQKSMPIKSLLYAGQFLQDLGHSEEAALLVQDAVGQAMQTEDIRIIVDVMITGGANLIEIDRIQEAKQVLRHALALAVEMKDEVVVEKICSLQKKADAAALDSSIRFPPPETRVAQSPLPSRKHFGLCLSLSGAFDQSFSARQNSSAPVQTSSNKKVRKGLVSIIILCCNEIAYTRECVSNIPTNTPEAYEIIFVDNGSSDETVDWLQRLTSENPHYKLIRNNENLGFAKGCNQGIEASSGEYILLLNNDTVVTDGWLTGLLECLRREPGIGIAGPMTNMAGSLQQVAEVGYKSLDTMHEFARAFREQNRYRRIFTRKISAVCMMFRRELIDRIDVLDERFGFGNFEDDDFCLRALLAGYKNVIAGDVYIHHYGHRSFTGNRIDYIHSLKENQRIINDKWQNLDAQGPVANQERVLQAYELALKAVQKNEFDRAFSIITTAMQTTEVDKTTCLSVIEQLLLAGQFGLARKILAEIPDDKKDRFQQELLGCCLEGLGIYADADECAKAVHALDDSAGRALNLMGILALNQGNRVNGRDFFHRAIEADPGFGEPYTHLGVMKWIEGQKQEALKLFEKGAILSAASLDVLFIYCSAVVALDDPGSAVRVLEEANSLYPDHLWLTRLLIDLLMQIGKRRKALTFLERAIFLFGPANRFLDDALALREETGPMDIVPNDTKQKTVSLCMNVCEMEKHLVSGVLSAKPLVDEIIVIDSGSTDRTGDLARALGAKVYEQKSTDDPAAAMNRALTRASGDWILLLDTAEEISPLDYDSLKEIIRHTTSQPAAYSFVTRRYVKHGLKSGWIADKKICLFTNDARIRFENSDQGITIGPALHRMGLAVKECQVLVHQYKDFIEADTIDGSLPETAVEEELAPNMPEHLIHSAMERFLLGDLEKAKRILKEMAEETPENPTAQYTLAAVRCCLGEKEKGFREFKALRQSGYDLFSAIYSLTHQLVATGQKSCAVSLLEMVVESGCFKFRF